MSQDLVTKNELAEFLKVHRDTIAKWEKEKKISSEPKEPGKIKRYSLHKVLVALGKEELERYAVIYASALSFNSKESLENHILLAKQFCSANGWRYMVAIDEPFEKSVDSPFGIGYLIELFVNLKVERVILPTQSSIGYHEYRIIEALCKSYKIPFLPIEEQPDSCVELIRHSLNTIKYLCKQNKDALKKAIDELY